MAEVKLKNITKKYGDVVAVKNMSLSIPHNEFLVLVGPSGCGKSTTLRMIAGLEEISGGEIYIGDQVVNEKDPKDRNISMVFQNYALYPHMTVEENLGFSLKIAKEEKNEIETRVKEAVQILGLQELRKRKPSQLSGGQRQRVAMGRAIVRRPDAFLFDEPLSNLDAKLRTQMRTEIKKLHQKLKTTVIYVTHDQVEAMTLADRIVILNKGNVEQFSSPSEVYSDPNNVFVAEFIGTPKMNIIKLEKKYIKTREINFFGNQINLDGYNFEDEVFVGIRPEHIHLNDKNNIKLDINVDLIENLGFEKIIYASIKNHEIRIKTTEKSIENLKRISFSQDNIYFFDKNGERLRKTI